MNLTVGFVDPTISRKGYDFFEKVQQEFELSAGTSENVRIICVLALFESAIPFTLALNKLAPVAAIIPKESTLKHRPEILTAFESNGLPVKKLRKSDLLSSDIVAQYIKDTIPSGNKFIIVDYGGYFAPTLASILQVFGDSLVGIAEYTENGHQKYAKATLNAKIGIPIVSVANSALKAPADEAAGESLAHALDHYLRNNFGLKAQNYEIGIVGFGRLGQATARGLQRRGACSIRVADIDPLKLISAPGQSFKISTVSEICKQSTVIISATGAAALKPEYYCSCSNRERK